MSFARLRAAGAMLAAVAISLGPVGARDATAEPEPEDATRVHVLLVADTKDKEIGESVEKDLAQMRRTLEDGLPDARRTIATVSGDGVTPANVLSRVRAVAAGPADAIVVYYAGHGAWADAGPYLRMGGQVLARSDLVAAMRERAPRLQVLLTDCCSTYVGETMLMRVGNADPDTFRDLFFRHKGIVDVTAARKGQVAVGDTSLGGVFTQALTDAFTGARRETLDANRDGTVSWTEVASTLEQRTRGVFEMLHPRGVTVKGERLAGQTPHVFGEIAKPAAGPIPKSPQRLGVRMAESSGQGVRVDEVTPGTPAAWAGLRVGDVVIAIRVVGEDMEETYRSTATIDALRTALAAAPGSRLAVLEIAAPVPDAPGATREVRVRLAP